MAFQSQLKVRFGDEDHAQIVYYPRFFHFFHCAFEDFFNDQGFPYRDCLDVDRVGWPAVHAEADYRSPVRFGDVLEITTVVKKLSQKSATFHYSAKVVGQNQIACTGEIVVVCVDMNTFRGQLIPEKYRTLFEQHLSHDTGA